MKPKSRIFLICMLPLFVCGWAAFANEIKEVLSPKSEREQPPVHMSPINLELIKEHIQVVQRTVTSNGTCPALPSGVEIAQLVFNALEKNRADFKITKKVSIARSADEVDPSALKIMRDIDVKFDLSGKSSHLKAVSIHIWTGGATLGEEFTRSYLPINIPLNSYCGAELHEEIARIIEIGDEQLVNQIKRAQGATPRE